MKLKKGLSIFHCSDDNISHYVASKNLESNSGIGNAIQIYSYVLT